MGTTLPKKEFDGYRYIYIYAYRLDICKQFKFELCKIFSRKAD